MRNMVEANPNMALISKAANTVAAMATTTNHRGDNDKVIVARLVRDCGGEAERQSAPHSEFAKKGAPCLDNLLTQYA